MILNVLIPCVSVPGRLAHTLCCITWNLTLVTLAR